MATRRQFSREFKQLFGVTPSRMPSRNGPYLRLGEADEGFLLVDLSLRTVEVATDRGQPAFLLVSARSTEALYVSRGASIARHDRPSGP